MLHASTKFKPLAFLTFAQQEKQSSLWPGRFDTVNQLHPCLIEKQKVSYLTLFNTFYPGFMKVVQIQLKLVMQMIMWNNKDKNT